MNDEVIITGFSNQTAEGIVLHTNIPSRLKGRNGLSTKEVWVSWDKIGSLLFDNYTEAESVEDRNKLRCTTTETKADVAPSSGVQVDAEAFWNKYSNHHSYECDGKNSHERYITKEDFLKFAQQFASASSTQKNENEHSEKLARKLLDECWVDKNQTADEQYEETVAAMMNLLRIKTGILINALQKIIDMNVQQAQDQYGDKTKAESWACVKVAREALSSVSSPNKEGRNTLKWVNMEDDLPPSCTVVHGFSKEWIDEDFNPEGIRECLIDDDKNWSSGDWNNDQDCWSTDNETKPSHWMQRNHPPKI